MKIKSEVIKRALGDKILIAEIAEEVGKDTQTVIKWLKTEGSLMHTLYGVYATIQRKYKLSDANMFEKGK